MGKNVLSQLRIEKNTESFDFFDYGCDYLTLSYEKSIEYFDDLLFSIDLDNSNFGILHILGYDFMYIKFSTSNGYALNFNYSYNGVPVPIMQYVKFNSNTRITTRKSGKVSIYGSYFRLEQIGEFYEGFLTNYLKSVSSEDPRIMRYDMRFDYFSKEKFLPIRSVDDICGYIHTQSTVRTWSEGGKLIDWSLGNPDTGRYVVRYYDKKIDTNKKNKRVLYSDFFSYKTVHRLEIEFLRAFTRMYTLGNLVDLEDKIFSVLCLKGKKRNLSQFYQYDCTKEINSNNCGGYFERYINATKKLIKAGYNPYRLIEEAIIGEYGSDKSIGLIEDFINSSLTYERH